MKSELYEEVIRLPAIQTIETVRFLHEEIRHHFNRLGPLILDVSQVEAIDAASLQLLAIAFIASRQEAKTLLLQDPSPAFVSASRLLGLNTVFGLSPGLLTVR
ncbi:STAS domain-containing protein [Candidatus Woesearchaeota archaeon]|nr:STAS domain-containing protein [Candidatus Woesearchaeota archaeon]